jgi:predicted transcriptional regulator
MSDRDKFQELEKAIVSVSNALKDLSSFEKEVAEIIKVLSIRISNLERLIEMAFPIFIMPFVNDEKTQKMLKAFLSPIEIPASRYLKYNLSFDETDVKIMEHILTGKNLWEIHKELEISKEDMNNRIKRLEEQGFIASLDSVNYIVNYRYFEYAKLKLGKH